MREIKLVNNVWAPAAHHHQKLVSFTSDSGCDWIRQLTRRECWARMENIVGWRLTLLVSFAEAWKFYFRSTASWLSKRQSFCLKLNFIIMSWSLKLCMLMQATRNKLNRQQLHSDSHYFDFFGLIWILNCESWKFDPVADHATAPSTTHDKHAINGNSFQLASAAVR